MPINVYRGDAPERRMILRVGPPDASQINGSYEFTINGKTLAVTGWDAGDIAAAWNALDVPEFAEVTASADTSGVYGVADALILTGPSDGTPFEVSIAATATVIVETITAGKNPINERQTVTIPQGTGGTFTLTFDGQTTAAIAYNASAADVQSALEALSNLDPGDVAVTGADGGPYVVEFKGAYAATTVATLTVDASGITGAVALTVETLTEGNAGSATDLTLSFVGETTRIHYAGLSMVYTAGVTSISDVETFLESVDSKDWTVTSISGGHIIRLQLSDAQSPPIGNVYINRNSGIVTASDNSGTVEGNFGSQTANERQRITLLGATGGTFTLTFDGQTTSALNYNATAFDVETALETLSNITAVNVSGTSGGPWTITFTDPGEQNLPQMTGDASSLTASGSVEVTTDADAGTSEVQQITVPDTVTGGAFQLLYSGDRSTDIAYDASAATVALALEGIEAIGPGGVTVQKTAPGVWRVTFTEPGDKATLAGDSAGLTVSTGDLMAVVQLPGGPTHWNDPLNWTLGRPPESGDEVWLDQPNLDLTHSLRQRTGFSLGDASLDTLQADGVLHLVDEQKVTLRTTDTLPGGLTPGDYYIVDADLANGTFKVATTRGGSPVSLSSATGTGTHTALVELAADAGGAVFNPTARFTGRLGLPRRNEAEYWEYRPQYLSIGIRSTGSDLVRIGAGDGPGSGRIKLDFGDDDVSIRVVQTGGSIESGVPACLLLVDNVAAEVVQLNGDTGLAFFPGETASIGSLDVRGGSLTGGEGLTIDGEVSAIVGSVHGRYLDSAGNAHRWE